MELMDAVLGRRSVRRYQEREVPRELLEELLEVACWAPSAENTQPWYFVVLTQPEELQNMMSTMEQVSESLRPFLEKRFPRHPRIVGETTGFVSRLGGAPVCILAFCRRTMSLPGIPWWRAWRRPSRTCCWQPMKRDLVPAGSTPLRNWATDPLCGNCSPRTRGNW